MSVTALSITAALLGVLAFFEPCTIATHTVFSARVHRSPTRVCCRDLLILFLSRSLLAAGLLLLAVAIAPRPQWSRETASALLAIAATVYIASRFFYIPVPHLAFHRLLARATPLSHAWQLGLSLPACTLPLFAIVAALTITHDSFAGAIVAGGIFAALFTLPTVVAAVIGLNQKTRSALVVAAHATPFITAALLYGGAWYLWRGNH